MTNSEVVAIRHDALVRALSSLRTATLGNIIGGAVVVSGIYCLAYKKEA